MSKLDSVQLDQLREIGAYLYQAREEQSRPLEEIAATTFIPLRLLKAIEAGQGDVLPEPVFIQGFIRRYADVLGLDGIVLSKRFSINREPTTPQPTVEPTSPPRKKRNSSLSSGSNPFNSRQLVYAASVLLGIVALGGLAYGIYRYQDSNSSASTPEPEPSLDAASSVISPIAQASPSPPVASPSISPTASPSAIKVDLELTGISWLRIVVDGQTEFEGTLQQGEQRSWTAEQSLTVEAGNAGAVAIAFNDGDAQLMGTPGSVERQTFTLDDAAQPSPSP